ncbi:uncharacterized protein LOC114746413 isoform X1 [Neltuma alba]|uniref:uncharacterized protein LOC114746110 isoform X1 n=1 Tax=Neltuma alba TaxID=207710 RepID=UPI0010A38698|nr:uncharacterized protein LOC114746110 isoform X1 [Prosopis alba]XP_028790476.1 uncharacterized protein LOC114746413 isoform X1 [Prosopis alba]
MASSKVSLKLLIDTKEERVLFAEASKEFIDFLFNLLRLPLGTVTRLLTKNAMVGCLGKLYESAENLDDVYLNNPEQDRNALLKPSAPLVSGYLLPAANDDDHHDTNSSGAAPNLYTCGGGFGSHCNYAVTYVMDMACPSCGRRMNCAVQLVGNDIKVAEDSSAKGFVKGGFTYTVMDDLEVRPMSTISTITLISKFKVKDISSIQERVVELGMEEGTKLLKASLQCKNVLTSVFLKKDNIKKQGISQDIVMEAETC